MAGVTSHLYRVSHDENELRELERIEPIQDLIVPGRG